MKFTYKYYFKPRHSDFDNYEIAHHSKFLCWFEEARYECFEQFQEYFDAITRKYIMPVTKLDCKYYQMVTSVDKMLVIVSLDVPITSSILHLNYRLMDSDEKRLYAKGYTEHVFMNEDRELVTSVPEEFLKLVEYITSQE